jgi:HEAT repeat protein
MCCFDSVRGAETGCCGGCHLERGNRNNFIGDRMGNCPPQVHTTFLVLVRADKGAVTDVRSFSADCLLDADGVPVYWLGDVRGAESVAFLQTLARDSEAGSGRDRVLDGSIMAIAFTADPAADAALDEFLDAAEPFHLREKAAFWMGTLRGKHGLDSLLATMHSESDSSFREKLVFPISQSKEPNAQTELMRLAKDDHDSRVRGQALFWLAQKAGNKVAGAIADSIENDPDTDVKKKAVFALTQMPNDEGVPLLIQVAKTNRNPAVRKDAVFWLGQSGDPRALQFITDVLTH